MRAFISYTRTDRSFAARLAVDLLRFGIDVWYDQWEILPGDSIIEKIETGLTVNDSLVVVLSPAASESRWFRRELSSSLLRALSGKSVSIIPVLKTSCQIPELIRDLHYADFTESYGNGFAELLAAFGVSSLRPAYSFEPRRVSDINLSFSSEPLTTLFPKTFKDWPSCLFTTSGDLDVCIILGSTDREKGAETSTFRAPTTRADILGTTWQFSRQVSSGTVRDAVRAVDLAAYLGRVSSSRGSAKDTGLDGLCSLDITVGDEQLSRNLILVGAPDTNIYFALATVAFRQRYGFSIPIRYAGDDQLYFTCDQIVSDLSHTRYPRLEESGYMHCGYLAMIPNPWSSNKVIILASGTRATGTQAALIALSRLRDVEARRNEPAEPWHSLAGNNRHNPLVPAKVVRSTRAHVWTGTDYFGYGEDHEVPPHERIPQRHIITDFEFLE